MASPNLSNVNSLYSLVATGVLTTNQRSVLLNPNTSSASYRISSIVVSNNSTTPSNVFVWHAISGSTFYHNLVGDRSIVAGNVNRIVSRSDRVVLDEGDSIVANTDSNVNAVINIFYEDASEFNRVSADYLIVAGGGGGGNGFGGAGGAGGMILDTGYLYPCNYCVIVGAGGAGNPSSASGIPGSLSSLGSICAGGGGGGGSDSATESVGIGAPGGSGGGGFWTTASTGCRPGGQGCPGQGFPGGSGCHIYGAGAGGGGGGGAGGPGGNGSSGNNNGGFAGPGREAFITGTSVIYSKGGLGGDNTGSPATGPANSGFGGDGGSNYGNGVAGGSGVVVVRYLGPARFTGGNVTNVGGYTIHTFNTSGNLCLL